MRWPRIAIDTGVEAAAIGIQTPAKWQVRTIVSAKNFTSGIFKHVQGDMGGRLQELPVLRLERVRWIHHGTHRAMLLNPAASVNGSQPQPRQKTTTRLID